LIGFEGYSDRQKASFMQDLLKLRQVCVKHEFNGIGIQGVSGCNYEQEVEQFK
jgi:hypothetical protein